MSKSHIYRKEISFMLPRKMLVNKAIPLILILPISWMVTALLINFIGISHISHINLGVFCTLLSLSLSFLVFLMFHEFRLAWFIKIRVERKALYVSGILLVCVALLVFLLRSDIYFQYGFMVFKQWSQLPLFDIVLMCSLFCLLLYAPAYILHGVVFNRFTLGFLEKMVFYPLVSMAILGFAGFLAPSFREMWSVKVLALPLFIFVILALVLVRDWKKEYKPINVSNLNLVEITGLALIIFFRLFTYYSALEPAIFLKQDMIYQAEYIARLNRYGLTGYLSSPLTERYTVFYSSAYSLISKLLSLPYCNTIIIATFFNHIFVSLAFYYLSKRLFRDVKKSLFSTFVFTILSGFSWMHLLASPPITPLSGSDLFSYIRAIHDKFGMYSGATVSTIYADVHALVRLWGLGVAFASIAALLSAYRNPDEWKKYFLFFSAGFLQIVLGHPTEVFLLAFTLSVITLLSHDKILLENTLKTIFLLSISALPFIFIFSYPKEVFFSLISTIILCLLGIFLGKVIDRFGNFPFSIDARRKILKILAIAFMYYYGLSLIAFFSEYNNVNIRYPIFTLWYSVPIQWGFIGFLSTLAIVKHTLTAKRWDFSLKYSVLMILFLLLFTATVNYVNLNLFYVGLPYPIMPHYFFPFLAISSAYIFANGNSTHQIIILIGKRMSFSIRLYYVMVAFLILIFSTGSLCHILSASYWNNISLWTEKPQSTSLTDEEVRFINFLYALEPKTNTIEEACFIPKDQPFPIVEGVEYQTKVRYKVNPEQHLIKIAGLNTPSRMIESALYDTKSLSEVTFLTEFANIQYLIVEKNTKSALMQQLCVFTPVYWGEKYMVFELSQLIPHIDKTKKEAILIEKISFSGKIFVNEDSEEKTFENVNGEILPLDNGYVAIKMNNEENFTMRSSTVTIDGKTILLNVRSTRLYFPEALNVAQQMVFDGETSFKILNTFDNKRLYIGKFTFNGSYKILPEPWAMEDPRAAQNAIQGYLNLNDIHFIQIVIMPQGMLWTVLCASALVISFKRKDF